MKTTHILEKLHKQFSLVSDPAIAIQQKAYMRHQFEYFGIKTKLRDSITFNVLKTEKIHVDQLRHLVQLSFAYDEREMHHAAIRIAERLQSKTGSSFIDSLIFIITHKSWWDTVDYASKLVGIHFKRFPQQLVPYTQEWILSSNLWLRRVAIIFQLLYHQDTNVELLFKYIEVVKEEDEFFIQKACGWALRQYSKTDAKVVLAFIRKAELTGLSRREGLKWITKHQPELLASQ